MSVPSKGVARSSSKPEIFRSCVSPSFSCSAPLRVIRTAKAGSCSETPAKVRELSRPAKSSLFNQSHTAWSSHLAIAPPVSRDRSRDLSSASAVDSALSFTFLLRARRFCWIDNSGLRPNQLASSLYWSPGVVSSTKLLRSWPRITNGTLIVERTRFAVSGIGLAEGRSASNFSPFRRNQK